jgi:hypothetical protein
MAKGRVDLPNFVRMTILCHQNLNISFLLKVEKLQQVSKLEYFANQTSSWNLIYQPNYYQIPTKRGFGYSFNLEERFKMFREK